MLIPTAAKVATKNRQVESQRLKEMEVSTECVAFSRRSHLMACWLRGIFCHFLEITILPPANKLFVAVTPSLLNTKLYFNHKGEDNPRCGSKTTVW
jgi:hypothetical protein